MRAVLVNPETLFMAPKHTERKDGYFDRLMIKEKTERQSFLKLLDSLLSCIKANSESEDEQADFTMIVRMYEGKPNFDNVFKRLDSDDDAIYYEFIE